MLIEQKLENIKLSDAQNKVMQFFYKQRSQIKNMNITDIAKQTYVSTTTVIRLAKKLGYHGFEDFKDDFLKEIDYLDSHFHHIDANFPFDCDDNIQRIASKITQLSIETMQDTFSLIEHDSLMQAVLALQKAKHIHLAAISYSLLLGQMFRLDMMRIGRNVNICDINGEELFMESVVEKEDCVIFISYSGQIEKLCLLAQKVKQKGATVIAITSIGDNLLKKYSDIVLQVSTREKLYSKIKGYSNENSIKLILDILYSCYFHRDYYRHLQKRHDISSSGEMGRTSDVSILKEA